MKELVGKEVIVSVNSITHRCVIEKCIGNACIFQMKERYRQSPAFQIRSQATNKGIACFCNDVAKMLSNGKALHMKLTELSNVN